eukprot:4544335-Amphidinium_carterae.2
MATAPGDEGEVQQPLPAAEPQAAQPPHFGADGPANRPKTSLSSIKLEKFNGERRHIDLHKEWKKSVQAHIMLYQLDEAEASLLLYLAVGGEAKQVLGVLELNQMTSQGGLARMWQLLNESYDQTAPDKYERARIQYERCARKLGETMNPYISNFHRCRLV